MAGRFYKSDNCSNDNNTNALECEDHRTINLIEHTSKIILRTLGKRLKTKRKILY